MTADPQKTGGGVGVGPKARSHAHRLHLSLARGLLSGPMITREHGGRP